MDGILAFNQQVENQQVQENTHQHTFCREADVWPRCMLHDLLAGIPLGDPHYQVARVSPKVAIVSRETASALINF